MKFKLVARVLAWICGIISLSMVLPICWAFYDGTPDLVWLSESVGVGLSISLGLLSFSGWFNVNRSEYEDLGIREAVAVVTFAWIFASGIGALPYWFSNILPSYADAYFEAMSGFTTAGGTTISNIEICPRGILFWRAMTHCLGGMGIVVLSLAVLPFIGVGGLELFKAEVAAPVPEKFTPRVHQTALLTCSVDLLLTGAETLTLMACGLNFFDALTHSFGTIGTGGFSNYNASIAHFPPVVHWVFIVFMFLAGVNFTLHYMFLRGDWKCFWRDVEFRSYCVIVLFAGCTISLVLILHGYANGVAAAIRDSFFQVLSIITTTGFVTVDYEQWPAYCRYLLLLLMFAGGCTGSTAGGIKNARFLMFFQRIKAEVVRLLQPKRVMCMRLNGQVLKEDVVSSAMSYIVIFCLFTIAFTLALTAMGLDNLTSFSAVAACICNVGPGYGAVGPSKTFVTLSAPVKWILSTAMMLGRLEITTVLLLFYPRTWRR